MTTDAHRGDSAQVRNGKAEAIARHFHGTYERLASEFGYETRRESAVPFDEIPERNRSLMIATVRTLLDAGVIR